MKILGIALDIAWFACLAYCLVWGGYVIASSDFSTLVTMRHLLGVVAFFVGLAGIVAVIRFPPEWVRKKLRR